MADFATTPRTPATMVTGTRSVDNTLPTRLIADVSDKVNLYSPSANPFQILTKKVRKKRIATQRKFQWLTKDQQPRTVATAAAVTAVAVSFALVAGQGARVAANYLLRNQRTGEVIYVQSVSTDTPTVVRGIGSIAQDMEAGDPLVFLATAFEDGAGKGTFKSVREDEDFNYTQIHKTSYGFTGRQVNTDYYGESKKDKPGERRWQSIEHVKGIEEILFYGTRSLQTGAGGKELTTTGGILSFLKSNIWNLGGSEPTDRAFVEYLEEAMKWGEGGNLGGGSSTKYLFAPDRVVTSLEFFGREKIQTRNGEDTFGLTIKDYKTSHGTVAIVKSQVLNEISPDTAFLLDLNHVRFVVHQGRDTKLWEAIQGNDIDGDEELLMTDFGLELTLEAAHSVIKGWA